MNPFTPEDYKQLGIVPPEVTWEDQFAAVPPQFWFQMALAIQNGNQAGNEGINKAFAALQELQTEARPKLEEQARMRSIQQTFFGTGTPVGPSPKGDPKTVPPSTTRSSAPPVSAGPPGSPTPAETQAPPTVSGPTAASPAEPPTPQGGGLLDGMGLSRQEQQFYALWMMTDPKAAMAALAARQGQGAEPEGGNYYAPQVAYDSDGRPVYIQPKKTGGYETMQGVRPPPTPGVQQQQRRSQKQMQDAANAASRMTVALDQMEQLLMQQGGKTGLAYPEVSLMGRGAVAVDETFNDVFGIRPLESVGAIDETTREAAIAAEQLDSLSKTVGIELLTSIGGNDTERELITAIETTYNPRALPESNLIIIRLKKAAARVAMDLPTEYAQWLQRYGDEQQGPIVRGPDGQPMVMTWPTYWRRKQREIMAGYGVPDYSPEEWNQFWGSYNGTPGFSSGEERPGQGSQQPRGKKPAWAQ